MTKRDDPFGKTELAQPAPGALDAPSPFAEGQTVFGPFQPDPMPGQSKPSRTILAAPDPEALASSEAFEKGFTDLGPGFPATQPPAGAPDRTEPDVRGPGLTMAGGIPPVEALAAQVRPDPRPVGSPDWGAVAAAVQRELDRADALHAEGVQAGKSGQFALADALLRESLDLRRRHRAPGDIVIAHGCVSLGTLYFYGQRPDLAEPLYREAWMLHREALGDLHPDTATRAVELARVLVPLLRVPEAVGMLRGAYEVYSRTIGPFHQATLEVAGLLRQLEHRAL